MSLINARMRVLQDTAANFTNNNPTLLPGEWGYETDTTKLKIGDGTTAWTSLGYKIESLFTATEQSKLSEIESGAAADQSGAEIKSLYESEPDTNALTDALLSKLNGIEAGATADQSNAEIKAAYESNPDSNAYTDAEKSKLAGIELGATGDQSGAEIKSLYESEPDTNALTDALLSKLNEIEASADVTDATNVESAGAVMTETDPVFAASEAASFVTGDKVKLDGLVYANNAEALALSEPSKIISPATLRNVLENMGLMSAYGVRWDTSASSPAMTKGIVAAGVFVPFDYQTFPVQETMKRCILNSETVFQYYLHPEDANYKENGDDSNIDGTDGQVMVQTKQFEYIDEVDGNYRYLLIGFSPFYLAKSDTSQVFSTIHPWFMEGGSLANYKYFSAFEGVLYDDTAGSYVDGTGSSLYAAGDKIHSVYGYIPMTYISRDEMRTACAVDGNYALMPYWSDHAMILLYLTRYATWNSQSALPGYTEGGSWNLTKRCKTGITATLGNRCGSVTYGDALAGLRCSYDFSGTPDVVIANSFYGIENVYGHIWKWLAQINIQYVGTPLTDANVFIANDPSVDADDTDTNFTDLGIDLPLTSGYQSALHPGTFLPSSVSGGGSMTFLTDYYYASSSAGWRALLSGGVLTDGAYAGVAFRLAIGAASGRGGRRWRAVGCLK